MPAILRTDEAKQMHDHAIEFERKLIAIWLKDVLPEKELLVLKTGMYKSQLACKVYAQGNTRPTMREPDESHSAPGAGGSE